MRTRPYFSVRTGKNPLAKALDLPTLKTLFLAAYFELARRERFQEYFGYVCVDAGTIVGLAGDDIDMFFLRKLRKRGLWPMPSRIDGYDESDLFDVVELLHDMCSKGTKGMHHTYNDCGWHYTEFDATAGQREFRDEINPILRDYADGFELSESGEILTRPGGELGNLLATPLPATDPANVNGRVDAAIHKFRTRASSWEDRKDAVRDLADVLEFLRDQIKTVLLPADEKHIFEFANRFAIRHHNQQQITKYNKPIWLSWAFHYYLATIHACVRMLEQQSVTPAKKA
jgi:hypothetical protein